MGNKPLLHSGKEKRTTLIFPIRFFRVVAKDMDISHMMLNLSHSCAVNGSNFRKSLSFEHFIYPGLYMHTIDRFESRLEDLSAVNRTSSHFFTIFSDGQTDFLF